MALPHIAPGIRLVRLGAAPSSSTQDGALMRTEMILAAMALVACACERTDSSTDIQPEPRDAEQKQGLMPPQRVRTAATDRDQLRAFTVPVPLAAPEDVIEIVEGPFVVTSILGNYVYPIVNFDGICPTPEE